MGLFTRKPRDGPVTTTGHQTHHEKKVERKARARREPLILPMTSRPSFGQWLKATWLDIATMAAMGMIGLGVRTSHLTISFSKVSTNNINKKHRSTPHIQLPPVRSPSSSKMARSSILSSPTPCVMRSSPSGPLLCSAPWCQSLFS